MLSAIRFTILSALLVISGCSWLPSYFKQDTHQGNVLDQEALDRLEIGMTKRQVRYLLGNPALENTFNPQKWHYIYIYNPGYGEPARKQVTLYFNGEVLTQKTGDLKPEKKDTDDDKTAKDTESSGDEKSAQ